MVPATYGGHLSWGENKITYGVQNAKGTGSQTDFWSLRSKQSPTLCNGEGTAEKVNCVGCC